MEGLEEKLGYKFKNIDLLKNALTHSSYANEVRGGFSSNERLEFLGDSVLSIIVSDYIYRHYRSLPEGELTKLRASLVCEKSLCTFSRELELGKYLMLGKGEDKGGGRERDSILADAFEAVLAAIYLDGGMEPAKRHVMNFVLRELKHTDDEVFSTHSATACRRAFPPEKRCPAGACPNGEIHASAPALRRGREGCPPAPWR